MTNMIRGLDVAALQGTPRYDLLKAEGIEFAYNRCHVGNEKNRDVKFEANVLAQADAGIIAGAYGFLFPLPHLDPIAQAESFLKSLEVRGVLIGSLAGQLPPAADLEWPYPQDWAKWKCTAQQIVDFALKYFDRLEQGVGCECVVYLYPWFGTSISKADGFLELVKRPLWIAGGNSYINGDGHVPDLAKEQPPKVAGWGSRWSIWQHDGNGGRRLPGTGVDADFNVFNGSMDDLIRFCGGEVPVVQELDPAVIAAQSTDLVVEDAVAAYRKERNDAIVSAFDAS